MRRASGLLLALDYGLKRIGVATGNQLTKTAAPLTTLTVKRQFPWNDLDALIAEWQPDRLVIGQPGLAAEPSLIKSLDEFVATLQTRYDIAIERVDEAYTSTAAEEDLRTARRQGTVNRRLSKGQIDQHAACLIAEQWMSGTLD